MTSSALYNKQKFLHGGTLFQNLEVELVWQRIVENSLLFTNVDGDFRWKIVETGVVLLVNSCATMLQQMKPVFNRNNGILHWMRVGPIAFFVVNSCNFFFYQSKILKTTIQNNYCDICSEERYKVTGSSLQMPLTIFYKILTVA